MPPPGIVPTQGSNPGLLHHRQILYHLSHQGSPLTIWEGFAFNHYLRYMLLMIISTIYSVCEVLVVLHVFQLMGKYIYIYIKIMLFAKSHPCRVN